MLSLREDFVVEKAENGEDYSTNPEFTQPVFYKYIWQVITEGIPMVQNNLDSILQKLCLNRVKLQAFLKRATMGRLSPVEFKGVSDFDKFCQQNIGEQSFSSHYAIKTTDICRSMLYSAIEAGDAFVTEKSKIDPI